MDAAVVPVRLAVEDDIPRLVPLIRAVGDRGKAAESVAMTSGLLREQSFRRSPPERSYLVAEVDQELVGYASYSLLPGPAADGPTLFVNGVFVLPRVRRHGIATDLIRGIAQIADRIGCERLRWQVDEANVEGTQLSTHLRADASRTGNEYSIRVSQIQQLDTGTP